MQTAVASDDVTPRESRRLGGAPRWALGFFAAGVVIAIVFAALGPHAGVWGLMPIILYGVLAVLGVDVVLATFAALFVVAIMTRTGPIPFGNQLATSLGAFTTMIGAIILLGAALGQVAQRTGAAQAMIEMIMNRIGLHTRTRVQIGIMVCSTILVAALGTLAGANAILAPVIIPIAARTRWRPHAVAVMLHSAGAVGLWVGPFTPPVVALRAATHLAYGTYLYSVALPLAVTTFVVGFFMARWLQNRSDVEYTAADRGELPAESPGNESNDESKAPDESERPAAGARARLAAWVFIVVLVGMTVYGIVAKAGDSFAMVIMLVTAALTGLAGRLGPQGTLRAFYEGAARLLWLFVLFWMLDPLLELIGKTGAFDSVFRDLSPTLMHVGPYVFLVLLMVLGIAHSIPGAAAAQVVLLNRVFAPIVKTLSISGAAWGIALLTVTQVDQFGPTPGADMIGEMGLARSNNLRFMLYNGWAVMAVNTVVVLVLFLLIT